MGVMGCFRKNCDNIMCDRYSSKHGYICNECLDELVNTGVETKVGKFMRSPKKEKVYDTDAACKRYNEIFTDTRSEPYA